MRPKNIYSGLDDIILIVGTIAGWVEPEIRYEGGESEMVKVVVIEDDDIELLKVGDSVNVEGIVEKILKQAGEQSPGKELQFDIDNRDETTTWLWIHYGGKVVGYVEVCPQDLVDNAVENAVE